MSLTFFSQFLLDYLGLKNFFVATVALPSKSELSFTIVCTDFDPIIFWVALFKNCPVLVIAPFIDRDACSDCAAAADDDVFPVWFADVAFVWACAVMTDDAVVDKSISVTKAICMLIIFVTMLSWLFLNYMFYVKSRYDTTIVGCFKNHTLYDVLRFTGYRLN